MYTKLPVRLLALAALLSFCGSATLAQRTLYVSTAGDDGADGLTEATAFLTITKGAQAAEPGDTVLVLPGTYAQQSRRSSDDEIPLKSGSNGRYITIRGVRDPEGRRPLVKVSAPRGFGLNRRSWLIVEGFEVTLEEEDVREITGTPEGLQAFRRRLAFVVFNGHNNVIRDNYVHDMPGNGIGVGGAEAILVEGNVVEHCAFLTDNANSGISTFQPSVFGQGDVPGFPGYGLVIKDNLSRYNVNLREFATRSPTELTDGNGIIIDDHRSGRNGPWPGRTLVLGNRCYGNGGPGVNLFQSDRIDVIHNTLYDNGISGALANQAYTIVATTREMGLLDVDQVTVVNNVFYTTDDERRLYDAYNEGTFAFRNNLFWGPRERDLAAPDGVTIADPMLRDVRPLGRVEREKLARTTPPPFDPTTPPFDPTTPAARLREPTVNDGFPVQDLRLTAGSPAIDAGEDTGFRTFAGSAPDIGALEFGSANGVDEARAHALGRRLRYDGTTLTLLETPAGARVFVYDALGRPIMGTLAQNPGRVDLDASGWPAGLLAVEVRYGGERWVGSVVGR